jgi:hypothetical protein
MLGGGTPAGRDIGVHRTLHRDGPFDAWLSLFGEHLSELDAACEREGRASLPRFRELDDDLWTVLLTRSYESFPAIRDLIPHLPDPYLQQRWNGASGLELLTQGKVFYRRARAGMRRQGNRPLDEASVLDFGCGWGRLTRFFIRDVAEGSLYGCDPVESILEVCRQSGIPASSPPAIRGRSGFPSSGASTWSSLSPSLTISPRGRMRPAWGRSTMRWLPAASSWPRSARRPTSKTTCSAGSSSGTSGRTR